MRAHLPPTFHPDDVRPNSPPFSEKHAPPQVKAVLGHLENTLLELASLGQGGSSSSGPRSPGGVFSRQRSGNPKGPAGGGGGGASGGGTGAGFYPGVAAGGIFGDAARPAWRQVLDRVKDLSRCGVRGAVLLFLGALESGPRHGAFSQGHDVPLCRVLEVIFDASPQHAFSRDVCFSLGEPLRIFVCFCASCM